MVKVVSVRFRQGGRVYFFDPLDFDIKRGEHVIVETARGVEYGSVVGGVKEVSEEELVSPLKPVIRVSTKEDDETNANNIARKARACEVCEEKIKKHNLDMKLIDAEYTFDNNKLLFYFTSDGRVDFRELVKDLASEFRTRIELRQIGVRDEIKMMGGLGVCGREICCHSYLSDFVPVSIKMAKDQNLSLNPTKISGVCGRLMCCLKNEVEAYEELNKSMPGVGDFVTASDGSRGEVISINVLRQTVRVLIETGDEREVKEYPAGELQFKKMYKKTSEELTEEEKEALAELEREELADKLEKQEALQQKQRIKEEKEARLNNKENAKDRPKNNKFDKKDHKRIDEKNQGNQGAKGDINKKKTNPNRVNNDANKGNVGNNRNSRHGRQHHKGGNNNSAQ